MKKSWRFPPLGLLVLPTLAVMLTASRPGAADNSAPIQVNDAGGGGAILDASFAEITDDRRRVIQESVQRNIADLETRGKLPGPGVSPPLLGWPLRPNNGLNDFGYHGTTNFVDLDPAFPDHLLDYACGIRTYDLASGYNHQGADYINWPFWWNKMDLGQVAIIAAAPGTIVYTHDGEYDRNCSFNNNDWNIVIVRHDDGSVAWYGHMKNGSVTTKGVGQAVTQGEYLGLVGSSGSSTVPHLHFEVHDASDRLIEPHAGACNPGTSWWANQRPYWDTAINKLTSGFAPPIAIAGCGESEQPNEATEFTPASTVWLAAYYRNQRTLAEDPVGATTHFTIYNTDGRLVHEWTHSAPTRYDVSYWYFGVYSKQGFDPGVYRWEAVYQGVRYDHYFTVVPESGPTYAQCVNACDTSRHACDAGCQQHCDEPGQGSGCISDCKDTCVDSEKECKDACQASAH